MRGRVSEISLSISGLQLLFLPLLISISSSWSPSLSSGAARRLLSVARQLYPDCSCLSALCRIFGYWSCLLLIEIGDKPIITWLAAAVTTLFGSTQLYVFNELKVSFSRKRSWCSYVDHWYHKKWAELAVWTLFCLSLWYTLTLAINSCSW